MASSGGGGGGDNAFMGGLGGALPGALLGLAGSVFGLGQQHEDPVMKQQRQFQQGIAGQQLNYANSAPGSSPDELANMAQSRGLLGQQQRATQQRAFSAYNPSQGLPAGQMMANLGNTFNAQQMAQRSGFLQDAAANRRQALLGAAATGMNAANLYRPQQSGFPAMAAQLAQQMAYQRGRGQGGPGAAAGGAAGGYANPNAPGDQAGADAAWNSAGGGGPQAPIDWAGIGASGQLGSSASVQAMGGAPGGEAAPGSMPGQIPPGLMQMLAALSQQMGGYPGSPGGMPQPGGGGLNTMQLPTTPFIDPGMQAPGMQGAQAPGNQMFGANGQANQARQASGISNIYGGNQPMFDPSQINQMMRQLTLPGGVRMPY